MPASTRPTPPPRTIDAPLDRVRLLERLDRATAARTAARSEGYRTDPAAWARDRLGIHLWSKQADIAESVVRNRRTAVRSSHGVGKTLLAAVLACWWLDTHPRDTAMVISTAPSHDQVHGVLWEYIRSLHARAGLPGTVQRSDRWLSETGKLIGFGRRPPDHSSDAFQGYHDDNLVLLDEAGGIPEWLWTASEALTSGDECRIVAIGNPTDSSSHFAKLRGSPVWANQQISTFDTPRFTGEIDDFPPDVAAEMARALPSPQWAADAKAQWGENSSIYRVRVLGEFADRDDGLIPMSWVSQAQRRWQDWHDAGQHEPGGRRIISVDPAWLGEDMTAFAIREADIVREVRRYARYDTTQTTALVENELLWPRSMSIVDVVGVGAGVVDQLRAHRRSVVPFNGAMATRRRDSTGQWRFRNQRSAAWYSLRELLDPALGATLALPPDDSLEADLTTPGYAPATGGYYVVESKDDIRKRLGRSPDVGDAVAQAMWINPSTGRTPDDDDGTPAAARRPRAIAYAASQFS